MDKTKYYCLENEFEKLGFVNTTEDIDEEGFNHEDREMDMKINNGLSIDIICGNAGGNPHPFYSIGCNYNCWNKWEFENKPAIIPLPTDPSEIKNKINDVMQYIIKAIPDWYKNHSPDNAR